MRELTLKQLQTAVIGSPLLLEYFSEKEQFYRALLNAIEGLQYLESRGLEHGDLSPCSISATGKLLDYLKINDLMRIAQGKKELVYDSPDQQGKDMWALGVSLFEFCYSAESH